MAFKDNLDKKLEAVTESKEVDTILEEEIQAKRTRTDVWDYMEEVFGGLESQSLVTMYMKLIILRSRKYYKTEDLWNALGVRYEEGVCNMRILEELGYITYSPANRNGKKYTLL